MTNTNLSRSDVCQAFLEGLPTEMLHRFNQSKTTKQCLKDVHTYILCWARSNATIFGKEEEWEE